MTICPTCKKDADLAVKAAYKLGRDSASQKLRLRINLLEKTIRVLFDEINELENKDPAYGITISAQTTRRILFFLKKHTQAHVLIKKLEGLLESEDFKLMTKLRNYIGS